MANYFLIFLHALGMTDSELFALQQEKLRAMDLRDIGKSQLLYPVH